MCIVFSSWDTLCWWQVRWPRSKDCPRASGLWSTMARKEPRASIISTCTSWVADRCNGLQARLFSPHTPLTHYSSGIQVTWEQVYPTTEPAVCLINGYHSPLSCYFTATVLPGFPQLSSLYGNLINNLFLPESHN